MIIDGAELAEGTIVQADVCIVGAGAAGISLAMEFLATSLTVLLVEAAGLKPDAHSQERYRGYVEPGSSHEPLEENRFRGVGGSTSRWGGRCVPMDAIDFEPRDYVSNSGWPISRHDLEPYYERANVICEAGANRYDALTAFPNGPAEMIAGFDGDGIVTHPLERWSPPTHFGKRYRAILAHSERVRVLLHCNCTRIAMHPGGEKVQFIEAVTTRRARIKVQARHYVIAGGALETTRLLLISNEVHRNGIGNHAGLLGRFYMAHLNGAFAVARTTVPAAKTVYDFERDETGVYCRRRFWITPQMQRQHQMMNAVGYLFRPTIDDYHHRSALLSSLYVVKRLTGQAGARQAEDLRLRSSRLRSLGGHLRNIAVGFPGLCATLPALLVRRWFAERRLPFVASGARGDTFYLQYSSEHAPQYDSRVSLHDDRDALGMQRLNVAIRFSPLDTQTILRFHRLLRDRFERSGTGQLIYDEPALAHSIASGLAHFNSCAHHLGTTRMSREPARGVVNPNCQIHGVSNLFIASGSVFPTVGHANPTLTIVALAVRLADHLKNELGKPA